LDQIVLGLKPGRQYSQERIMSMNLGLAIEDIAVAARIYDKAVKLGIGQRLQL